ncbi:unnamed protein product, partial [Porites evermanni]
LCKTNGTEIQRKDISFLLSKTKDAFAVRKAMVPCSKLIFRKYFVPIEFFRFSCKFSVKLEQGYYLMSEITMKLSAEQNGVACEQAQKRSARAHSRERLLSRAALR